MTSTNAWDEIAFDDRDRSVQNSDSHSGAARLMECQHDKVYIKTFEQGRILWICRTCHRPGSEADNGDPNRNFDHEEYFRQLEIFNNAARSRARVSKPA